MEEYLNEKEQWERLLAGLREQAPWMLAGVAVVAAGFSGWHYWQAHLEHNSLAAAAQYNQELAAFTRNDLAGGLKIADDLEKNFRGSAYADQGNLAAARVQAENQQLEPAAARLTHVMQATSDHGLALIARLRLARVQLAQNKPDEAIKTVDAIDAGAFAARYAELRGDALLVKGDRDGALKQYRAARAEGADTVDPALLDLKINELAPLVTALQRALCVGLCATAFLLGCSKDKADKPAVLVPIVNRVDIKSVWHTKIGGEKPILRLGLGVAVDGERAFAASYKGTVIAYEVASGKQLWQRSLRAPLSAGPAAADGLLVMGSSKGDVIAWSEQDGAPRWRVRINSEILSAAAIGNGLVVVRGVDGKLHGLSANDGNENWVVDQQVPRLSLRGTSRPILVGDLAVCGFDNGRVAAVAAGNGSTAWETAVGQSHGSTELQRLIDVDASVVADGDDLFAVAYQGRVARLARENGQIVWARDLSSFRGLAVDANAVYVSTAEGDVVRLDRRTGTEQWRQKSLERRQLSAPVVYGGRLVVADLAGLVHWIDAGNGDLIARFSVGKQRISTPLVVAGDLLLVFGDGGELNALRAPALEAK